MIKNLDISTKGDLELTADIRKYVERKIAKLDRYATKHAKKSIRAEVRLWQEKGKKSDKFTAEVLLYVPDQTLTARESTLNIYAAIDIVEAKLKNQLRRYKEQHVLQVQKTDRKGVLSRIKRLADRDFRARQN